MDVSELFFSPDKIGEIHTPFPDQGNVLIDEYGTPYPWEVSNDGVLVTLRNTDPQLDTPWLGAQVQRVIDRAPAVSNYFDYQRKGSEKIVVMPTVRTAQLAQGALFEDIETANIMPYQTNGYQTNRYQRNRDQTRPDNEHTPVDLVLYLLCQANKQPFGSNPEVYAHDLLVHWLGSAGQEPQSFSVYKGLYRQGDLIGEEHGEKARKSYMKSLGQGFDSSTAQMIRNLRQRPHETEKHPYLLGATITSIIGNCDSFPGIIRDSMDLIEQFGFGRPQPSPNVKYTYVVPGELEIGPAHYKNFYKALHQSPLTLPRHRNF